MKTRGKILVVDDEPFNREIMQEILEPAYEVSYAESGPECLELASRVNPGVILLDINMPGMSGYEVCQALKANDVTRDIPVTFVSALDTLAERLAGYEVGGIDYITKPFEARELLSRVNVALEIRGQIEVSTERADMATSMAMTALNSTSELGVVLHFLQNSFKCNELEALAQLIIEAMQAYQLVPTVQIRCGDVVINKSGTGQVNPLEATVIDRLCTEGKIVTLGNRSIFNFDHVSILLKKMPVDDEEKLGRYKDNLALLAEGADARVQAIKVQMDLRHKQQRLVKMLESTRDAMDTVSGVYEKHQLQSKQVLATLVGEFEASFSSLGLTGPQERYVTEMISRALADTIEIYDNGQKADDKLVIAMADLRDIVDGLLV